MDFKVQFKIPGKKANKLKIGLKKTFCTLNDERKNLRNETASLKVLFTHADVLFRVIKTYEKVTETV